MIREFVYLPSFLEKWKHLGLNEDNIRELENILLKDPKIGPVMKGTGKVRKLRFAFQGRGKSGSSRVVYVDFEVFEKIYFLDVYAKNEKENLSQQERNELKQAVEMLEMTLRNKRRNS